MAMVHTARCAVALSRKLGPERPHGRPPRSVLSAHYSIEKRQPAATLTVGSTCVPPWIVTSPVMLISTAKWARGDEAGP